jgi:hypothetical protein
LGDDLHVDRYQTKQRKLKMPNDTYFVSYLQSCGKCPSGCEEWELIFAEMAKYSPEYVIGQTITFESFKKEIVKLKIIKIIKDENSKENEHETLLS